MTQFVKSVHIVVVIISIIYKRYIEFYSCGYKPDCISTTPVNQAAAPLGI